MRKLIAILAVLSLMVCSCKTKYIETVKWQTVEMHDTVDRVSFLHDSITLHDSVYIHTKNDTVYSEKWHTKYKWSTKTDTVYRSREVPYIVSDTVYTIKEVPVEKEVFKQHWWQRITSGVGLVTIVGLVISLLLNIRRK